MSNPTSPILIMPGLIPDETSRLCGEIPCRSVITRRSPATEIPTPPTGSLRRQS
jgi:hypothetical protein